MTGIDIIDLLERYWGFLATILAGLGSYITWRRKRQESTLVLYDKLEELKLKIITQISREIELSEEIAEKRRLIEEMKANCPDCYNKFINDREKPLSV